ncbi:hypothetical protein [Altererythrobacter aquiaggeris]|uniref:hypothetical protein n=1 Tax=Aestuarierythrobacter aquiaggeris TaxID=1898396 RepID=UPI003018C418
MILRQAVVVISLLSALPGCGASGGSDHTARSDSAAPARADVGAASQAVTDAYNQTTSDAAGPQPECAGKSATAFSCRVSGGKQLSVCVAGDPAVAQYRFGAPRAPGAPGAQGEMGAARDPAQLVLVSGPGGGRPVTSRAAYSGGGEAQIRFANGGTGYVVFSRIIRTRFDGEGNEPAFSAGVMIETGGDLVSEIFCVDPADAELDIKMLEEFTLQDDEEFFVPMRLINR